MFGTDPVWVLGSMSGTSLDGVDAAMILTDGQRVFERGAHHYRPYTQHERNVLSSVLGRWPGEKDVEQASKVVTHAHAECFSHLKQTSLIGFHGQTIAHDPKGKGTHQVGNGSELASQFGLPVAWDFRTADVSNGGEGAPFASFYHFALAREIGPAPVAFLNLGGVGNLTWVDPSKDAPEEDGALLAFDTGPANAPLNNLMNKRRGQDWDEGGALALLGRVNEAVVEKFMSEPYFTRLPPKSLDRNDFEALERDVADLPAEDAAATLVAAIAASVQAGTKYFPKPVSQILVTGGGRHNKAIMGALSTAMPCPVLPVEDKGLNGDMLEAEAFAFLAMRTARGLPLSAPGTTGVPQPVCGGCISYP